MRGRWLCAVFGLTNSIIGLGAMKLSNNRDASSKQAQEVMSTVLLKISSYYSQIVDEPPDIDEPDEPTSVSYPCGREEMKSCAFACLAASTTRSRRMFFAAST